MPPVPDGLTLAVTISHEGEDVDAKGRRIDTSSARGLGVALCGGLCFGFFSPAFNLAVNDELGWIRRSGHQPLPVFAANWWFGLAFAASAWAVNLALMRWPPPGEASAPGVDVLFLGLGVGRGLAALAGVVCAFGNASQFLGGSLAGFAAADLVQAFPLVGTMWGVLFFKEFRGASGRVLGLLAAMYGSFVAAVCLLALSVR